MAAELSRKLDENDLVNMVVVSSAISLTRPHYKDGIENDQQCI